MSNVSSSKSLKELAPKLRFPEFTEPWEESQLNWLIKMHPVKKYLAEPQSDGIYEVIQQGNDPVAGYSNLTPFEKYEDVTLFGDHTLSLYKPTKPFLVASDGLKIIFSDILDKDFLYYLLSKYMPKSEGYKRHLSILKDQQSYYPDNIYEQKRIANLFKAIDNKIAIHNTQLKLLNMYKRGVLQKVFGQKSDRETSLKLKEIIEPLKKTDHQADDGKEKGAYPFFTNSTKNIQKYIDIYDYDDCVVIANTGGNAKFRYVNGKFAATSDCYIFKTSQNTRYIYYLLEYMTDVISQRGFRGNGIKHLDRTWFLNMDIDIHSLEKQVKIANLIATIDQRIQKEEHILEQLKTTKTGLLQQMFV